MEIEKEIKDSTPPLSSAAITDSLTAAELAQAAYGTASKGCTKRGAAIKDPLALSVVETPLSCGVGPA